MTSGRAVAIMQPYFLPYLGYWQLMNFVDMFVVYDDVQYTKRGWINRNRFLLNGRPEYFSLPLRKGSSTDSVAERWLSDSHQVDAQRTIRKLDAAYKRAPHAAEGMALVRRIFDYETEKLFDFLFHSISVVREVLEITTELVVSSELPIDRTLRGQERVIAICEHLGASMYVNPIGGISLYSEASFSSHGIRLQFQKVIPSRYQQFGDHYEANLSILDAIMFIGSRRTTDLLTSMHLV